MQALSPLAFFMKEVWGGLWGLWCLLESALSLPTTGSVSPGSPQILGAASRVMHLAMCLVESATSDTVGKAVLFSVACCPSEEGLACATDGDRGAGFTVQGS